MQSQEFTYEGATYKPDDEVRVDGFPGTWTIQAFNRNPRDTNGEWCAALVDGRRRLFWPAHHMKKVSK